MSRMLCKCGAVMGSSISPSPYSLNIYYKHEICSAIKDNPDILLLDFLTGWDELRGEQKQFMKRSEPAEYWYCTECHRVYEVQMQVGGHWLRVYRRSNDVIPIISYDKWTCIYVLKETETDVAIENNPHLCLSEYLKKHDDIRYLLSPDERAAAAVSTVDNKILYTYIREETE